MARLRSRRGNHDRADVVDRFVDRRAERSLRKLGLALYLLVFMGAGIATGYVAFHAAKVGKYWYVPVVYDGIAVLVGGLLINKVRRVRTRLIVESIFGILLSFGVGVWLGGVAK